jgi:hypothetical protein
MRIGRTCPLAALVLLWVSSAHAHTTIRVQVPESTRVDNVVRIGHGCGEDLPVRAQSVVFPTDAPLLAASDPSATIGDLSQVIEQGSLAGLVNLVQDRSVFARQREKTDTAGNAIGFYGTLGHLEPELVGRVPFESTGPNFVAESCAVRLIAEVAVADLCKPGARSFVAGQLNLWIPDNGSQIAEAAKAAGVEGVGAPARLTIVRNLTSNPLPAACGAGYDVTITPSPEQIDRDLPIPGWPKRRAR